MWIKDMCMPSPSRNGLERSTPPTRILVPEWTRIGVNLRKHLEFRYVTYVMVNLLETYHTNYILQEAANKRRRHFLSLDEKLKNLI